MPSAQPQTVAFVYSNPGHHVAMMAPVMRELIASGARVRAISLAELRGLTTRPLDVDGVATARAIPAQLRRSPSAGASLGTDRRGAAGQARRLAQAAVWAALSPRLVYLLRGADTVVVPNDAAYPYRELCGLLRRRGLPFVLMQEGIRFPLPGVASDDAYGAGGARAICAWGEASAAYFRAQGAAAGSIHVTGSPRFDDLDVARGRQEGEALRRRLELDAAPLLFLSNPIDDQGFCTTEEKLALFDRFVTAVAPTLARRGVPLVVKLHPREDASSFRAVLARSAGEARALVIDDAPLTAVLGSGRAAIVLASTVGVEALLFGLPLGVLEVPGHGFVFDYVSSGAAQPIAQSTAADDVASLLDRSGGAAAAYVERQLAFRGAAAARVSEVVLR